METITTTDNTGPSFDGYNLLDPAGVWLCNIDRKTIDDPQVYNHQIENETLSAKAKLFELLIRLANHHGLASYHSDLYYDAKMLDDSAIDDLEFQWSVNDSGTTMAFGPVGEAILVGHHRQHRYNIQVRIVHHQRQLTYRAFFTRI